MSHTKEDRARFRLMRAKRSLDEARVLSAKAMWTGAANRLYYASCYGASALLAAEELESAKHSGVQAYFNQHFVKPGHFPDEVGQIFNRLLSYRSRTDYRDFEDADEASITAFTPRVERFVETTAQLLKDPYQIEEV